MLINSLLDSSTVLTDLFTMENVVMKKCIKVSLINVSDVEKVFNDLKNTFVRPHFEGVAYVRDENVIECIMHGKKEVVDEAVERIQDLLINYQLREKSDIDCLVEPHIKDEDYRGVFRFIQN